MPNVKRHLIMATVWRSLRKGGTLLYVEYGSTYTNHLYGHDCRVRVEPKFEVSLDLGKNLRTRNTSTNQYSDAKSLASGDIERLKTVQISDAQIIDGLSAAAKRIPAPPDEWTLTIELQGQRSFRVQPQLDSSGTSLFLRVIDPKE